jgi:hypothetical protein
MFVLRGRTQDSRVVATKDVIPTSVCADETVAPAESTTDVNTLDTAVWTEWEKAKAQPLQKHASPTAFSDTFSSISACPSLDTHSLFVNFLAAHPLATSREDDQNSDHPSGMESKSAEEDISLPYPAMDVPKVTEPSSADDGAAINEEAQPAMKHDLVDEVPTVEMPEQPLDLAMDVTEVSAIQPAPTSRCLEEENYSEEKPDKSSEHRTIEELPVSFVDTESTKVDDETSAKQPILDVSMDITEATELSPTDEFTDGVEAKSELTRDATEHARSFDIDWARVSPNFHDVQVPVNKNEAASGIKFTGEVGTGSRSVITNHPLPKPETIMPPQIPQKPVSTSSAQKPKKWKRLFGGTKNKNKHVKEDVVSVEEVLAGFPEPVQRKPFVFPFQLPDGTLSFAPRLVSYYEVEIVPSMDNSEETTAENSYIGTDVDSIGEETGNDHPTPTSEFGFQTAKHNESPRTAVAEAGDGSEKEMTEHAKEIDYEHLEETKEEESAFQPSQETLAGTEGEKMTSGDDIVPSAELVSDDEDDEDGTALAECIAVGLSTEGFHVSSRLPGWDSYSVGYHGDDGTLFYKRQVERRKFGPAFVNPSKNMIDEEGSQGCDNNNIVGCGIDYRQGAVFYTLNGAFLGYAVEFSEKLLTYNWYPTVGVDSRASLVFNFGYDRPFSFDLQGHIDREKNNDEFDQSPISDATSDYSVSC